MAEAPLPPGSIIGILGGGQLGRMLALAAARLGLVCHIFSDRNDDCGFQVVARKTFGSYDDAGALEAFARDCGAITFEFENVPRSALDLCADYAPIFPPPDSLATTQDRLSEKDFLSDLGIPAGRYQAVGRRDDLVRGIANIGLPAILKTRRFGYDGKGQRKIETEADAESALAAFDGAPLLMEAFVPFEREVSVIVVRSRSGEVAFYDPVENVHRDHRLHTSTAPAALPRAHALEAQDIATRIAGALGHVGTLCVELFHLGADAETPLVVNEIAPRVHNSGHWTIDACLVSQFANHIRAVAGWPLGRTDRHSDAVMTNLIGDEVGRWREFASESCAVHIYGKGAPKPGRKMGHVTRIRPRPPSPRLDNPDGL